MCNSFVVPPDKLDFTSGNCIRIYSLQTVYDLYDLCFLGYLCSPSHLQVWCCTSGQPGLHTQLSALTSLFFLLLASGQMVVSVRLPVAWWCLYLLAGNLVLTDSVCHLSTICTFWHCCPFLVIHSTHVHLVLRICTTLIQSLLTWHYVSALYPCKWGHCPEVSVYVCDVVIVTLWMNTPFFIHLLFNCDKQNS